MLPLKTFHKLSSANWARPAAVVACSCDHQLTSVRTYRGRRTHNIGRIVGILQEPKKLMAISDPKSRKSQRLVMDEFEDLISSTIANQTKQECEEAEREFPNTHYGVLNFVVTGFDICLVEKFAQFVHRTMIKMEQDIVEVYAHPTHDVDLKDAKGDTANLEKMITKMTLSNYTRVIQVQNIKATTYPILLQILMNAVPQSVKFQVREHVAEDVRSRLQRSTELEREKELLQKLVSAK